MIKNWWEDADHKLTVGAVVRLTHAGYGIMLSASNSPLLPKILHGICLDLKPGDIGYVKKVSSVDTLFDVSFERGSMLCNAVMVEPCRWMRDIPVCDDVQQAADAYNKAVWEHESRNSILKHNGIFELSEEIVKQMKQNKSMVCEENAMMATPWAVDGKVLDPAKLSGEEAVMWRTALDADTVPSFYVRDLLMKLRGVAKKGEPLKAGERVRILQGMFKDYFGTVRALEMGGLYDVKVEVTQLLGADNLTRVNP